MQQFKKTISLDVEPGTVSERLYQALNAPGRRGKAMNLMRNWLTAGKLLDECGHGIMHYLMAMDRSDITQKELLSGLITYLQRIDVEGTDDTPVRASVEKTREKPVTTGKAELTVTAKDESPKEQPRRHSHAFSSD